jgi:hypothetical protein
VLKETGDGQKYLEKFVSGQSTHAGDRRRRRRRKRKRWRVSTTRLCGRVVLAFPSINVSLQREQVWVSML